MDQTHHAKVSWVAVLIGKSPKVSERQRGSPECNCVWRFCKSHTLLFVQHAINIVCNTCPTHCESYLPGPRIATEHNGLAVCASKFCKRHARDKKAPASCLRLGKPGALSTCVLIIADRKMYRLKGLIATFVGFSTQIV